MVKRFEYKLKEIMEESYYYGFDEVLKIPRLEWINEEAINGWEFVGILGRYERNYLVRFLCLFRREISD